MRHPDPPPDPRAQQPRSAGALWLELLGPPVVWLTQFEIRYVLAARPETAGHTAWLVGVWIVALSLIACLALSARHQQMEARSSPLDLAAGVTARTRFMSLVALMSCALFALVIFAQGLADFFFEPGER